MGCFKGKGVYAYNSTHIKPIQIQRTIPVDCYEIPSWYDVHDTDSLIYQQSEILSFQLGQLLHLSQEREHLSFQIEKEHAHTSSKRVSFDMITKKSHKKMKRMRGDLLHVSETLENLLGDKLDTEKRIDLFRLFRVKALTHELVRSMDLQRKDITDYAHEITQTVGLIKREIQHSNNSIAEKEEQLEKSMEVLRKYKAENKSKSGSLMDRSKEVETLIMLLEKRLQSLFECIHEFEKLNLVLYFPFRDPRRNHSDGNGSDLEEQLSSLDGEGNANCGFDVLWDRKSKQVSENACKMIRSRDEAITKLESIVEELIKDLEVLRANRSRGSAFVQDLRERSQRRKIRLVYNLCLELTSQCDYIGYRACLAQETLPFPTEDDHEAVQNANSSETKAGRVRKRSHKRSLTQDAQALQEIIVSGVEKIKKAQSGDGERLERLSALYARLQKYNVEGLASPTSQ
ncbi:hypothetical protein BWQ96_09214 [Gracilariopsis chorda]|uniref:Uncharacterized protein n=1 Tax=Gracilariopsis chorda TaxID=448386 RepID=A0A2V3IG71_9FLOR|nr:hypothetical protein BWQ96_09214 [Gracilariopsis chorda]|eukprot:PXF41074.1 hypothetical protein BWQ96_09214 [Gracilariopsis chorda]